jgi:hypothetical protein
MIRYMSCLLFLVIATTGRNTSDPAALAQAKAATESARTEAEQAWAEAARARARAMPRKRNWPS